MRRRHMKKGIILRYILFAAIFLFTIFPLYWIISCSFREASEIQKVNISVIQKTFTIEHYIDAITKIGLLNGLKNSAIVTLGTLVVTIPVALLCAYAFAYMKFKGKKAWYALIMLTQFIPIVAYIVPLYLIMSRLHLLNTIYCLWITYLSVAYPMAVILLTGYVGDIPVSIVEAAYIDGCNEVKAMQKVVLPLSVPGIITSATFVFISIWQEYFIASSFVNKPKARTVSMAMKGFVDEHSSDWGGLMAASVMAAIPVIILFLFTRKKLVNNLAGGVKG